MAITAVAAESGVKYTVASHSFLGCTAYINERRQDQQLVYYALVMYCHEHRNMAFVLREVECLFRSFIFYRCLRS